MPRDFSRSDRIADALQQELVELIRDEMRDPRISMVNITAVEVSRDLAVARVFVNFVVAKPEEEALRAIDTLNGAAGFLRTQLARRMRLRTVPKPHFYYDTSGEHGQKLSALIDLAINADKTKHPEAED